MAGSGTASDPYIITTVADLQNMKDDVTAYYELGGNIDASDTSSWNSNHGFIAVGNAAHGTFSGQLDGKGYKITSLFATWQSGDTYTTAGLFENSSGTIQNLGMESCDITGLYATALVGYTNSGTITKCYVAGAVVGDGFGAGLALINSGTITNCYSRCSVTGDGSGFIAGFNEDNTGGTIDDCYSTGAVSNATFEGGFDLGGGTITNCFFDTETSGQANGGTATGKTTAEMKIHHTFAKAGWDFSTVWSIASGVNNGYPALGQITSIGRRYIWLEGEGFHYFDEYGIERILVGTATTSDHWGIMDWM